MISKLDVYNAIPENGISVNDLAKNLGVFRIVILKYIKDLGDELEIHGEYIFRKDYDQKIIDDYQRKNEVERLQLESRIYEYYQQTELYPEILSCVGDEVKAKELLKIFVKYCPFGGPKG